MTKNEELETQLFQMSSAAGSATAQELKDGAKVRFVNEETGYRLDGGTTFTLVAQGKHESGAGVLSGAGIFQIKKQEKDGTEYMLADNKVGEQVVFGVVKPEEATKWILFDNGGGWSIIHAASGANALIRTKDAETTTLSRNRGSKAQKWVIKLQ